MDGDLRSDGQKLVGEGVFTDDSYKSSHLKRSLAYAGIPGRRRVRRIHHKPRR